MVIGVGDLIVGYEDTNFIYHHSGLSDVLLGSVADINTRTQGVAVLSGTTPDLINSEQTGDDLIYHRSGFTTSLVGSFVSPGAFAGALTINIDTLDLISCDGAGGASVDHIFLHSGISNVLLGSFAAPGGAPRGVGITADGDLLSADSTTNFMYHHSGISSVLLGSFAAQNPIIGTDVDENGNALSSNSTTTFVVQYSGLSDVVLGSFAGTGTGIRGIHYYKFASADDVPALTFITQNDLFTSVCYAV